MSTTLTRSLANRQVLICRLLISLFLHLYRRRLQFTIKSDKMLQNPMEKEVERSL